MKAGSVVYQSCVKREGNEFVFLSAESNSALDVLYTLFNMIEGDVKKESFGGCLGGSVA